jgi:hypothetical protein
MISSYNINAIHTYSGTKYHKNSYAKKYGKNYAKHTIIHNY